MLGSNVNEPSCVSTAFYNHQLNGRVSAAHSCGENTWLTATQAQGAAARSRRTQTIGSVCTCRFMLLENDCNLAISWACQHLLCLSRPRTFLRVPGGRTHSPQTLQSLKGNPTYALGRSWISTKESDSLKSPSVWEYKYLFQPLCLKGGC